MSLKLNCADKTNNNSLQWRRSLLDRKANFRLIVYSHSSTNLENLANISLVDFEIICLAEIVKK